MGKVLGEHGMKYTEGFELPQSVLKADTKPLDSLLQSLLDAGISAREGLRARWETLEAMYRMEPDTCQTTIFEGQEVRTTPLIASRVDRLADNVQAALMGVNPHCQALPYEQSQQKADDLEAAVQSVMDAEGFAEYQRLALRDAPLCGMGIVWCPINENGVQFQSVHPGQFVMMPNISHDMRQCYFIGNLTRIPYFKLLQLQSQGKIRKDAQFIPGSSSLENQDGSSVNQSVSLADDAMVPQDFQTCSVWQLLIYCKIGKREGWWSVMFSDDSRTTLAIHPYEYSLPWYAVYRIHFEPGRFWPECPRANRLQALQNVHSVLTGILEQGGAASTTGILVLNGVLKGGEKMTGYKPGAVYQVTATGAGPVSSAIFPAINIGVVPGILEKVEQDADTAIGVTRTGTGQELNNATATEVQALQATQAQAENTYANCAAIGLESIAGIIHEYLRKSWATMENAYGLRFKDTLSQCVDLDVEWKASGKVPDSGPQAQMQKMQAAYQLSQNPNSILDQAAVERRIIENLGLGNIDDLLKENQDYAEQNQGLGMVEPGGGPGVPQMAPEAQAGQAGGVGPIGPQGPGIPVEASGGGSIAGPLF